MKTCIVCGNQMPEDEMVCGRCGFLTKRRRFLSERHYRAWIQETVEPARLSWQRQELERQRHDIEQQRKQLEEQKRQIKEQWKKLKKQQKLQRESECLAQNSRTEWNTSDSGWDQTAKEQKTKKKGGVVKNALISFVEFVTAGLISRAVIAPSSSSSSVSSNEIQSHIVASIDEVKEPVELSQEQLYKAAKVGFDLNLFENLPLTSRKDIIAWLEEKHYSYEEFGGENHWMVKIGTDRGNPVKISYRDQTAGTQSNYTMYYTYHENYRKDDTFFNMVKQLMQEHHKEGSVKEDHATYYDNAGYYYIVWKTKAIKVVLRKAKQREIDEQVDQLARVLNEMPKIKEKQETLDWIAENSYYYKDKPRHSRCNVDLGIWSATYHYEKFWDFKLYDGNAKKYYETVCKKLKDAGFKRGKETKQDNRRRIDYTLYGKWSIRVMYNLIYHYFELYCTPL